MPSTRGSCPTLASSAAVKGGVLEASLLTGAPGACLHHALKQSRHAECHTGAWPPLQSDHGSQPHPEPINPLIPTALCPRRPGCQPKRPGGYRPGRRAQLKARLQPEPRRTERARTDLLLNGPGADELRQKAPNSSSRPLGSSRCQESQQQGVRSRVAWRTDREGTAVSYREGQSGQDPVRPGQEVGRRQERAPGLVQEFVVRGNRSQSSTTGQMAGPMGSQRVTKALCHILAGCPAGEGSGPGQLWGKNQRQ